MLVVILVGVEVRLLEILVVDRNASGNIRQEVGVEVRLLEILVVDRNASGNISRSRSKTARNISSRQEC